MSHLGILAECRDVILLAEAIGWLHDYRKCSDEQLRVQAANKTPQDQGLQHNKLAKNFPELSSVTVSAISTTEQMLYLLNDSQGKCNESSASFLLRYLSRCHNTAHFDKQDPDKRYGQQSCPAEPNAPMVQISSPFGFERDVPSSLTSQLWSLPWAVLSSYSSTQRDAFRNDVSNLLSQTIADTRRPINEVDLWSWGLLVGALYKAALTGALLGNKADPRDLHWRLLSVRLDGLSYVLEALRLPDLLARRALVTDALNRVQELLEVTYPLGSEVYRDETGSLFVVPDLPGLLDNFPDQHGQSVRRLILREFAQGAPEKKIDLRLGHEVSPEVHLEMNAWWGQDPDRDTKRGSGLPLNNQIPSVGQMLASVIAAYPQPVAVEAFWQNRHGEVCSVCGLRPQGPGRKALDRKVCDTCEQRRSDRSRKWATSQPEDTIWINEVSDINGRLALITGRFELAHWLDGRLIESLVLIAPDGTSTLSSTHELKSASFSRIRRVWETTRRFWQEISSHAHSILTDDRRRLRIWFDRTPDLGDFHAYELELGRTVLSLVWYPLSEDGTGGHLVSADNMGYIARQLGAEKAIYSDPAVAAVFVEDFFREEIGKGKQKSVLRNPEATGKHRSNLIADCSITRLQHQDSSYSTAIPILAEPRTFMAIVPADKALDIIGTIKTKYEREMGKVRNRLPLHLGMVCFQRRTPLRAALDAGRRMLGQKPLSRDQPWTVQADATKGSLPERERMLADGTEQFQQTITLQLERDGRSLDWHVPGVMGDGATPDNWYPYVFMETGGDDSRVNSRSLAFKGHRPTVDGTEECWLVHACELKKGDQVYFTPATFDFEWLDTSARRFEIAYDDQGKRYGRISRPYLLDDLDSIRQAWELIAGADGLTTSQIHALRDTIESRREAWSALPRDDTFRRLCRDAIQNALWRKLPPRVEVDRLAGWAAKGLLTDSIELCMGIMKKKSQCD